MRWAYSPDTHDLILAKDVKRQWEKIPIIWLDEDGIVIGWRHQNRRDRVAGPFNNVEEAKLAAEMLLV